MKINKPWLRTPEISGTPIAIYQMGKVGSRTIVTSLQNHSLENSVHHCHVLSAERLSSCNIDNVQFRNSHNIRKYLDSANNQLLNVITPVREPIAQQVSSIFQNLENTRPDLADENGDWNHMGIRSHVHETLNNFEPDSDWYSNWFDLDFLPALGIDVYRYPFDYKNGFLTIENGNLRVLLLRLENSNQWPKTISEFLKLDTELPMQPSNTSAKKTYDSVYRQIRNELDLPNDLLRRIYGTKYCQHFYPDSMIDNFVEKWSSSKKAA